MTANQSQAAEYDVLEVKTQPTSGQRAFMYGAYMMFDRIPVTVLFPESRFPEAIIEACNRMDGERISFPRSRRDALEEWYAATRYVEQ